MDKYNPIETVKKHYKILVNVNDIGPAGSDKRRKLQKLMQMNHGVIPTPDLLYEKHIQIEITAEKAIILSLKRFANSEFQPGQNPKINTVFEDPQKFFSYPDLNLIISRQPVKVYRVLQLDKKYPIARCLGTKWAIFHGSEPYHFNPSTLKISAD